MILVDSSVWVDHLRESDAELHTLLLSGKVLSRPFVIGEIAVGSIKDRDDVLRSLMELPTAIVAHYDEVLQLISHHRLLGLGIGYVEAHLLTAVRIMSEALLWTRDKRLLGAAVRLGVAYNLAS